MKYNLKRVIIVISDIR